MAQLPQYSPVGSMIGTGLYIAMFAAAGVLILMWVLRRGMRGRSEGEDRPRAWPRRHRQH